MGTVAYSGGEVRRLLPLLTQCYGCRGAGVTVSCKDISLTVQKYKVSTLYMRRSCDSSVDSVIVFLFCHSLWPSIDCFSPVAMRSTRGLVLSAVIHKKGNSCLRVPRNTSANKQGLLPSVWYELKNCGSVVNVQVQPQRMTLTLICGFTLLSADAD